MRVTLIHNPAAGEGKPSREALMALLRQHGYDPVYRSSRQRGWDQGLGERMELVIVAGGDGTVEKVGRRLAGRGVPIALLPLGTANNIASSIGVAAFPQLQMSRWKCASCRRFDVGVAATSDKRPERRFLESIGCGLFAELLRRDEQIKQTQRQSPSSRVEPKDPRGELRALLRKLPPRQLHVELDGTDHSGPYVLIEIMNTPSIGAGLRLAPQADPGDGWLDIVLVGQDHAKQLDSYLWQERPDTPPPELRVRRAQRIVLAAEGLPIHIDDELWDAERNGSAAVTVRLEPGALTFLTG